MAHQPPSGGGGPPYGYPPPPGGHGQPGGYPQQGGHAQQPGHGQQQPGHGQQQPGHGQQQPGHGQQGGYPQQGAHAQQGSYASPANAQPGQPYPPHPQTPAGYGGAPQGGGYGPPPGGGFGAPPVMGRPAPLKPATHSKLPVAIALGCGGLLVVVSIIGALVLYAAGERSAADEDDDTRPRKTKTTKPKKKKPVASNSVWIKSSKPNVRFLKPPGWKQTESGRWGVFKSPDGNAVLAFAGFNRPNESTKLIGRAARVLGVDRVRWRKTTRGFIGKDRFPARVGSGSCNFRGSGVISYATINPGGSDQLLVVHTVSAKATEEHRRAVQVTLKSLQRR